MFYRWYVFLRFSGSYKVTSLAARRGLSSLLRPLYPADMISSHQLASYTFLQPRDETTTDRSETGLWDIGH